MQNLLTMRVLSMSSVSFRSRFSVVSVTTCAALLAGGGLTVDARQLPGGDTTTVPSSTTTTVAAPDPSTTVPATTTAPPPPAEEAPPDTGPPPAVFTPPVFLDPTGPSPADAPSSQPAGDGAQQPAGSPPGPQLGSAEVDAILRSMVRTGASSTATLLESLRTLESLGFDPAEAARVGFGQFPAAGLANYRDDFYEPRTGPPPHLHQGNDIFAAFDTPARAPVDGVVSFSDGGLGGKGINLNGVDGTLYYFAHMNSFADIPGGSAAKQGDVIGFIGDSGNARGGAPHIHFEIRPGGGAAINPKPILDKWLSDAEARVDELIATFQVENPRVLIATGQTRQFDLEEPDLAPQPSEAPVLWASSVSPVGSTLRLAEMQTARLAPTIDWDKVTAEAQEQAVAHQRAADTAHSVLAPLTPPLLNRLLGGFE